jgi:hypothetical protein
MLQTVKLNRVQTNAPYKKVLFSSMISAFYLAACQAKDVKEGSLRAINVDGPAYLGLAG